MKKKLMWLAILIPAVLVVIVFSTIGLARMKIGGTLELTKETVEVPTSPEDIAEGRRLFVTRSCVDCHGDDLSGNVVIDDPLVGVMAGSNLTSGKGGRAPAYKTTSDWVMAIRHGVDPQGNKLVFMPSYEFHHFSDAEVGKLIAYIQSVPPVDNTPPKTTPGFMLSLFYLKGDLPLIAAELIGSGTPHGNGSRPEPGVALGEYLAQGCIGCHGPGLSGGSIPGVPPDFPKGANITTDEATGIGKWTEANFQALMQTGKRPDGSDVNPFMPWKNFGAMTPEELSSLWQFLRTVPAKPFGNR